MGKAHLIADISHNNGSFDAPEYAKTHTRIRLKATEGTTFTDPTYADRVHAAHTVGLEVDHYHFVTAESGEAQADFFLTTVRPHLKPGDRFMADAEVAGVDGAVVGDFVDRCDVIEPTVPGLIYGSPYFLRDNHIISVHGWGLVLADYTTAKAPIFWPPGFEHVTREWQFTETAHTAGIDGESDLSRVVKAASGARDLSFRQHRRTVKFTHAMNARTHAPTAKAVTEIDAAITAAAKAKGIKNV